MISAGMHATFDDRQLVIRSKLSAQQRTQLDVAEPTEARQQLLQLALTIADRTP